MVCAKQLDMGGQSPPVLPIGKGTSPYHKGRLDLCKTASLLGGLEWFIQTKKLPLSGSLFLRKSYFYTIIGLCLRWHICTPSVVTVLVLSKQFVASVIICSVASSWARCAFAHRYR